MPSISNKAKVLPESPIRKLATFAQKVTKEGKHIYHLNIGQPDIETPKEALRAIRNHKLKVLAYSDSRGFKSFRDKLTRYYAKHSIIVEPKDILITTGASEALSFTISCVTDPGDEIIIPEPFYANYSSFSSQVMANIVPVTSRIEDGFALPPIQEFEKLITKKTKAILICNPSNPTGYLYTKEEIKQLAVLAIKHDLFLISDEVYREFIYDGSEHYSILREKLLNHNAIVIDSVSKRYNMCGARIGCIVSRNPILMGAVLKYAQARLSPPTLAQIASEAALGVSSSYFTKVIAEYKLRRDVLVKELKQIPGVKVVLPKGAFYCIAEFPIKDAEDFARWLLEEFHLDNETIMLTPASGFYSGNGKGLNQVRIAYVLNKKDLKRAITILRFALERYIEKESFFEYKQAV